MRSTTKKNKFFTFKIKNPGKRRLKYSCCSQRMLKKNKFIKSGKRVYIHENVLKSVSQSVGGVNLFHINGKTKKMARKDEPKKTSQKEKKLNCMN